ncbi:MAG: tetratricopeptide repeat protein [Betaproteobacteria bacterium]|nr:tetratricopeptide repeat protein [Betaproteobacteria bacterium]
MAYDLEEQEQLATLKAFWARYGNFLLTALTVVLLAIAGWRAWGWHQAREAAAASVIYDQLQVAAQARDVDKVRAAAGTLVEQHGRTAYGPMGALLAARVYFEAGDLKAARAPLQWVMDNAADDALRQLARVRLAGVLLDQQAYDEGLKLLAGAAPAGFEAEWADRRGDLLIAQGKTEEARAEYRTALEKAAKAAPLRRVIQIKLDALGGAGA